jgi:putative Mg2+ transporter-C (MgtC) family protein
MGATLTALIGVYLDEMTGGNGDIGRISAQVISGIGFLGAGMIIVKNNNVISGLTTAAGVWTTSIIGIAIGYGFYYGAIAATVLFMIAIVFFTKLEKKKNTTEIIYIEIDDMYKANKVIKAIGDVLGTTMNHSILPAKSRNTNHLGIHIVMEKKKEFDIHKLCEIEHVVFVEEE